MSDWRTYRNGDFIVHIDVKNGTKIRQSNVEHPVADFAENCDVTITTRCTQGCPFCYLGCSRDGRDADFGEYDFLDNLHPYTELAINGNDLDHPQLVPFLWKLWEQDVLVNVTVNQNQYMNNLPFLKRLYDDGFIHGVGVSLSRPNDAFFDALDELPTTVLHTIAGVLSKDDVDAIVRSCHHPRLLVLGYKERGRGSSYAISHDKALRANMRWLSDNVVSLADTFPTVSFDNKAIEQLNMREKLSDGEWERLYMGDDGSFTFYLDLVNGKYGLNSTTNDLRDIANKSIDEMFHDVRRAC